MDNEMAGYRDLLAWQLGVALADHVYTISENWPKSETYSLSIQARKAAVSVSANIAEGQGRKGDRQFRHHLNIAHGSLCELETLIRIATLRSHIDEATEVLFQERAAEAGRMLKGLIRAVEKRISTQSNPSHPLSDV